MSGTASLTYGASLIKRHRLTKAAVLHRRVSLYEIVKAMQPMTVRQVFYQAEIRGLIEKLEAGYKRI